jgi:hypothetical protein
MTLIRVPRRPVRPVTVRIAVGLREAPESWLDYLYWTSSSMGREPRTLH